MLRVIFVFIFALVVVESYSAISFNINEPSDKDKFLLWIDGKIWGATSSEVLNYQVELNRVKDILIKQYLIDSLIQINDLFMYRIQRESISNDIREIMLAKCLQDKARYYLLVCNPFKTGYESCPFSVNIFSSLQKADSILRKQPPTVGSCYPMQAENDLITAAYKLILHKDYLSYSTFFKKGYDNMSVCPDSSLLQLASEVKLLEVIYTNRPDDEIQIWFDQSKINKLKGQLPYISQHLQFTYIQYLYRKNKAKLLKKQIDKYLSDSTSVYIPLEYSTVLEMSSEIAQKEGRSQDAYQLVLKSKIYSEIAYSNESRFGKKLFEYKSIEKNKTLTDGIKQMEEIYAKTRSESIKLAIATVLFTILLIPIVHYIRVKVGGKKK